MTGPMRARGLVRNRSGPWLGVAALLLATPAPALAFVARSGSSVVVSEAIHDDLYAAGGTVTVTAAVKGDVVAAGGTVELEAPAGGVLAAAGTVRLDAPVARSVRAVGVTLLVRSRVGSDAVLSGGTVTIDPAARIGRDLVVGAGNATVSGTVGRNATVAGGDVMLEGPIRGNAELRATRIVLRPGARIGGRLRYSAEQPIEVQPGAQVVGGIERIPVPPRPPSAVAPASPRFWLGGHVAELLALLALGLVVFGVAPGAAATVARQVGERFAGSLLAGFLLLVAALLALFTIVGIPLSVISMLLYAATLYLGQIFVAAWLGHPLLWRVRRRVGRPPAPLWGVVVGTIVLIVLFAIPYAGWALRLAAVLAGFGALWIRVWSAASSRPPTAV